MTVKDARTNRRLTQSELAELAGTTTGVISRWECGVSAPKAPLAAKILRILEVPSGSWESMMLELRRPDHSRRVRHQVNPAAR